MPRSALEIDITYRRELRGSNQAPLAYTDDLASLSLRLLF
jgi:hypothetical protein